MQTWNTEDGRRILDGGRVPLRLCALSARFCVVLVAAMLHHTDASSAVARALACHVTGAHRSGLPASASLPVRKILECNRTLLYWRKGTSGPRKGFGDPHLLDLPL
jgi:hypothetical protein